MTIVREAENLMAWTSNHLGTRLGSKLFRRVTLGALLATATALYISISLGEAGSALASGEATLSPQSQIYTVPEDSDLAEAPYDESSKNFIRISAHPHAGFQWTDATEVSEPWEEDAEERLYDELRTIHGGIPACSSELCDVSHTYVSPEILEEDVNERVYDELMEILVGIPLTSGKTACTLPPTSEDR